MLSSPKETPASQSFVSSRGAVLRTARFPTSRLHGGRGLPAHLKEAGLRKGTFPPEILASVGSAPGNLNRGPSSRHALTSTCSARKVNIHCEASSSLGIRLAASMVLAMAEKCSSSSWSSRQGRWRSMCAENVAGCGRGQADSGTERVGPAVAVFPLPSVPALAACCTSKK